MGHAFRWLIAHRLRIFGLYAVVLGGLALAYPVLAPRGWGEAAIFAAILVFVGVEFGQVVHNARDRAARGVSLIDRVVAEKMRSAQPARPAPPAPPAMIDHVSLGVRDVADARAFYAAALAPLGHATPPETAPAPAAEPSASFGQARPQFRIIAGAGSGAPVRIAFSAQTRAQVDAFHAAALAAGGTDNGAPGPHGPDDTYRASVHDPDGNVIDAICRPAPPHPDPLP